MEYTGDRKNYKPPERTSENDVLEIKLFCNQDGCNQYIKGVEGYNGGFISEDGETADLRNECWYCDEHRI